MGADTTFCAQFDKSLSCAFLYFFVGCLDALVEVQGLGVASKGWWRKSDSEKNAEYSF